MLFPPRSRIGRRSFSRSLAAGKASLDAQSVVVLPGAHCHDLEKQHTRLEHRVTVVADDALLKRMRGEFLEMPGLSLTREQAQRLCGVEQAPCPEVLDLLVDTSFLCLKPDGAYARLTDDVDMPHPRPAKADLRSGRFSVKVSSR
jgi:hypothetical protein